MKSVARKSINAVKESMQRCLSKPEFINRFHDEFMSNTQVQEKFNNTNITMQKVILKSTLHLMLNTALSTPGVGMLRFAVSHDRNNKAIQPYLYQYWLDALVSAVKTTDPQFTPELESEWRNVMQPGIDFMCEMY